MVVFWGYVCLFGKLVEFCDVGIFIFFFMGNYDMWMFDYFQKELDVFIYCKLVQYEFKGKKFFIGYGDGLGFGDYGYKLFKKVFVNCFCQWLFVCFYFNFGIGLVQFFLGKSCVVNMGEDQFYGFVNEWLL